MMFEIENNMIIWYKRKNQNEEWRFEVSAQYQTGYKIEQHEGPIDYNKLTFESYFELENRPYFGFRYFEMININRLINILEKSGYFQPIVYNRYYDRYEIQLNEFGLLYLL
jgi:hypothetical protein